MATRTITTEAVAYATKYGVQIKDVPTLTDATKPTYVSAAKKLQLPDDWTPIGTATITLTLHDNDTLTTNAVAALRKEKTAVLAEAQAKATDIERQIQELLAITNEVSHG